MAIKFINSKESLESLQSLISSKFKKIIKHYKRMGHSMDIMRQSACLIIKVKKKAKIRNQHNQVPHVTRDTTRESDKNSRKHHTQDSQEFSPFPAGVHKAVRIRQDSIIRQT